MTYKELVRVYYPDASDALVMKILWDCGISIWKPVTEADEELIRDWKDR